MSRAAPLHSTLLSGQPGVRHGFFTREGGVSEGIYEGLNCGLGSKDDPVSTAENRRRAMAALGLDAEALVTPYQIHSADVLRASGPWRGEPPKGDALVTDKPGVAVGVVTADCAPVLLADARAGVVGAAHAGWRGALAGVIENTVSHMESLGATRSRIAASVGPCIAQKSYEVGPDMRDAFLNVSAGWSEYFVPGEGDRLQFDLKGFCCARLKTARVGAIEMLPHDTYPDEALFYSNRRAVHRGEDDYGRLLSAIVRT